MDLAARAFWKGFLKLSLVSCPIALYPALAANERISFRQVNKQTGNRLRHQLVDTVTGEQVQSQDKARGYEVGENKFLLVHDEEIEAAEQDARRRPYSAVPSPSPAQKDVSRTVEVISPAPSSKTTLFTETTAHEEAAILVRAQWSRSEPISSVEQNPIPTPTPIDDRTIQLDHFIPKTQVDPRYLNTPYYIVPTQDIGQEAFAVIRDAMRNADVVGIGRVVLARRERPLILEPMGDGIRGTTLRYQHEIRDATDYFARIPRLKLPAEMVRIAQHIIQAKTTDIDLAFLEDRYRTVLIEELEQKHAEKTRRDEMAKPPAESVISLMEVLKRSLAAEWPKRPAVGRAAARRGKAARSKTPGKQAAGRMRKLG
jgi:DNA end-binding protein Ku